jgi:ribosomal-protein-alanine N-acetyltransferase
MMIRMMQTEDLPAVAAIERECFSQPWSQKGFSDALCNSDALFFVAEEDAAVLGYIGMYISIDEGEITNVAVGAQHRGRGVGRALLERMLSYAAAHDISRIVLEVRVSNTPAITLYTKCGFVCAGIRKGFYELPKEDAEIMIKE